MKHLLVILSIIAASGCSILGAPTDPSTVYLLNAAPCAPADQAERGTRGLVIREVTAPQHLATRRIAWTDGVTVNYYQLAMWAEQPASALTETLVQSAECSGIFRNVTARPAGISADYALSAGLIRFEHEVTAGNSAAIVTLRAELADLRSRTLSASRLFSARVDTRSSDSAGAVNALTEASWKIGTELNEWLRQQLNESQSDKAARIEVSPPERSGR